MSSLQKDFNTWKLKHDVHGPMALTKYVMYIFVDQIFSKYPNKYIFKGGNLLWYYIKTPRPTVDLDFFNRKIFRC